jgi:8-oxo-dGTP pyrophosphatase MutT (NUDIX family)
MGAIPELRPAATVILVRDRQGGPYEIFLMRRHRNQAFMGGAYVFPGGRLDEGDSHPDLLAHLHGLGPEALPERLQEPALPPETALGLHLTAIREMFEEAGVLLAVDASGAAVDFHAPETARRFAAYREVLHRGEMTLKDLAAREGLRFALDLLLPYAHWMTPEIESKRFDTRFFLARLPAGQRPVHDEAELTASVWMTPSQALAEHQAGRIVLMPPTLKTVEELAAHRTTEAIFKAVSGRAIPPILPQPFTPGGEFGVKLPFDPEYTIDAFKLPPRPGETCRIVTCKGIWTTATA